MPHSILFDGLTLALLSLSMTAALIFPFLTGTTFVRSLTKTAAVGALAVLAARFGFPLLAFALAASALGDLALSREGDRAFLIGMLAFAAAHLAYVVMFVSQGLVPFGTWQTVLVVIVLAIGVWLGPLFAANAGLLAIPVLVYVAMIALMGATAAMQQPGPGQALTMIGAFLFMASDAIIGQERFLQLHWRGQGIAIWGLYYVAQCLLFVATLMAASN